jgi:hypothetical protein
MNIEPFVTIQKLKKDNITFIFLTVNKDVPTSLQWRMTIDDIKESLEYIKSDNGLFGFIMDVRKIGIISPNYIMEFVKLLSDYGPLLEEKLIATSVYTSSGSIIDVLFAIVKRFYKTKKPLKFVYTPEDAYKFIDENKNVIVKDRLDINNKLLPSELTEIEKNIDNSLR